MADNSRAKLAAYAGMEQSIIELDCMMSLLSKMHQAKVTEKQPDGTVIEVYDDWDELNLHDFLICNVELRITMLKREFFSICDLGKEGRGND